MTQGLEERLERPFRRQKGMSNKRRSNAPVNRSAIDDSHHQHGEFLVHRFVNDPVLAHAEPSKTGEFAFQNRSGEGLGSKAIDHRRETVSVTR